MAGGNFAFSKREFPVALLLLPRFKLRSTQTLKTLSFPQQLMMAELSKQCYINYILRVPGN